MKRKIVQHGSSSLTITLPIAWAERFHLKKGDELSVTESGPMLLVSTEQQSASPKKEVATSESGVFTKNNLSHLYQLGYDEIELHFEGPETIEAIRKRIPDCIGFEVIDQKPGHITIKSIASTIESEFDTLLRKSFLITDEMATAVRDAATKGDLSGLAEARTLEQLNNKFTNTCLRILNKRGYKMVNRTMQMYEIVKMIERIADDYRDLIDALVARGKPRGAAGKAGRAAPDAIDQAVAQTVEYYLTFSQMFFKFSPDHKQKIYEGKEALRTSFSALLERSSGQSAIILHLLLSLVQKTYDASGGYFALML